jgi:hypothetical protein
LAIWRSVCLCRLDPMKLFPVVRHGPPITVRDEGPMGRASARARGVAGQATASAGLLLAMFSPFSRPLGNL